jgi:ferric-dicitrate binding protein FerR (iron transport regulator)
MSDNTLIKVIRFLANEAGELERKETQTWIDQHNEDFDKIKFIYENTPFEEKEFDTEKGRKLVIDKIRSLGDQPKSGKKRLLYQWLKVAAVITLLITAGLSSYYYDKSLVTIQTNNTAQVIDLSLPDGSEVTLDKNATLTYKKDWFQRFSREVHLSGRAYFEVKHLEGDHHFCVNFDNSRVEVFGTKFTVSDNFGNAQVVLDEGKVKVTSERTGESFILSQTGEQLIISGQGKVKRGIVNQNLYFSWLENKLRFQNCMVSEAVEFLMDSYNLELEMKDKTALNKRLYGSAPSDNPDLIVKALAKITDKKIRKTGDLYILD